jgi:F-type H+-transporting ATPase subunit gamma
MEMVAAAKLRRAQQRIETLRPFANSLVELTVRVSKGIQAGSSHPLLQQRDVSKVCIVMFTGDRGLAGALNANVLRRSLQLKREWEARDADVRWIGVGKKGVASLIFRKQELDKAFRGITDSPKYRDAEEIATGIIEQFEAGDYDKVILVYNHFESAMTQTVIEQDLLPLTDELLLQALASVAKDTKRHESRNSATPATAPTDEAKMPHPVNDIRKSREEHPGHTGFSPDWHFEPDSDALLARLLPTYVEQTCYRALLESTASEHGARMTAMRNASENAVEIIDNLTLERNRARQAAITQEILEVVGGAEAL